MHMPKDAAVTYGAYGVGSHQTSTVIVVGTILAHQWHGQERLQLLEGKHDLLKGGLSWCPHGAHVQVDQVVGTAYLGLTESECIVAAKNYTLTVANVKGSPPANVWNFCAIGVCTFYYADGRFITLQTFGSNNTESVCQLGYSVAVDNNEWVEPAIAQTAGVGNAGEEQTCL